MATTSRGVGAVKRKVSAFLEAQLPNYLAGLRQTWGVTTAEIPDIVEFNHNPPRALDVWPMVAVSATGMPGLGRTEYVPDPTSGGITEVHYSTRYDLRVFVWVREEGWDRVIDVRDDLTAAVRTLLVDRPTFGDPAEVILLDESTVVEEYSDVQQVKGERFVAGSIIGFEADVHEIVGRVATVINDDGDEQLPVVDDAILHADNQIPPPFVPFAHPAL